MHKLNCCLVTLCCCHDVLIVVMWKYTYAGVRRQQRHYNPVECTCLPHILHENSTTHLSTLILASMFHRLPDMHRGSVEFRQVAATHRWTWEWCCRWCRSIDTTQGSGLTKINKRILPNLAWCVLFSCSFFVPVHTWTSTRDLRNGIRVTIWSTESTILFHIWNTLWVITIRGISLQVVNAKNNFVGTKTYHSTIRTVDKLQAWTILTITCWIRSHKNTT